MLNNNPAEKSLQVCMFGRLQLSFGSLQITSDINRSLKLWNVLCYLIINRNRVVTQSELIDIFWSNDEKSNPSNALKTLMSRLRNQLTVILPKDLKPIITVRGAYRFNPEINCVLDADLFENLCKEASNTDLNTKKRLELYSKAIELYKGAFLPRLSNESWVIPIAIRYNNIYLDAVKEYSEILYNLNDNEQIYSICSAANALDPLDESINIWLIRAMLKLGNAPAAMKQYQTSTDLLYKTLGVKPSDEFRALYKQILEQGQTSENDIETVLSELKDYVSQDGVFMCDFSLFKEIYCLESRRNKRSGNCVHISLLTITSAVYNSPQILNTAMDNMKNVLDKTLRKGDVVSRYSGSQYVIMLPSANFEDATMVMNRIINKFNDIYKNKLDIQYKVQPMF